MRNITAPRPLSSVLIRLIILLVRLTDRFGDDGKAQDWFKSYLSGLIHFAAIGSAPHSTLH